MFKTIEYSVWPDKIKFNEKIESILDSVSKEFNLKMASYGYRKWDNSFHITIDKNERFTCDNHQEFIQVLSKNNDFISFTWHICLKPNSFFKSSDKRYGMGIDFNHRTIDIGLHADEMIFIDRVSQIIKTELGLKKPDLIDNDGYRRKMLNPTIFISRHFDSSSNEYYYRFERYLNLLGFEVLQGEEYTSGDIPDKVKHRIDKQDILLVMVTGEREHDWLIAEIGYAVGKGKHIILFKENESSFNTTILGKDMEYFPLSISEIDKAFCSLLSEFRSIGIKGLFY